MSTITAADLTAHLDRDTALALLQGAIRTPSITGDEAAFAAYLGTEMEKRGIAEIETAEFAPGRPNVWGTRKGTGGGRNLLFIGHTDTVRVDGWQERWQGTDRESPFCGELVDGAVWGRGACDLKAGICASLSALSLIDAAGITLKGDLSFAFVGDEESGEEGSGVSAGVKHYAELVNTGGAAKPDFAVYVEPTRLNVYAAQMGFFIADVTVKGKSVYFGFPEQGHDALKAANSILTALYAHSDEINARAVHGLVGRSFLLPTGINAGGYIAVPGDAKFSLIRKLLPGESLDEAVAEMEAVIERASTNPDITVEIAYPAGRDHHFGGSPCGIDTALPAVQLLSAAAEDSFEGRGAIEGAPYWSEAPFFVNGLDVPAVYCAPGDIRNAHTTEEHVDVEEYWAGIVAFARFIIAFCNQER